MGLIRYNVRRDWSEKRRNNINPDPVIEKGQHEPIITEEVREKTKSIMASRGGKPNRIHSGEFPLTGIMKCPACGSGMVLVLREYWNTMYAEHGRTKAQRYVDQME